MSRLKDRKKIKKLSPNLKMKVKMRLTVSMSSTKNCYQKMKKLIKNILLPS
jgi:hypothetical protein